jgi:hypothetical protein
MYVFKQFWKNTPQPQPLPRPGVGGGVGYLFKIVYKMIHVLNDVEKTRRMF